MTKAELNAKIEALSEQEDAAWDEYRRAEKKWNALSEELNELESTRAKRFGKEVEE